MCREADPNPTMTFHTPTREAVLVLTGPTIDNVMPAFHPLEQPLRDAHPELALGNPSPPSETGGSTVVARGSLERR